MEESRAPGGADGERADDGGTGGGRPLGSGWLGVMLGLSGLGIAVALYLTRLHLDLFYGVGVGESICDLGGSFSCSTVNASPQSEIAGIPQALLAIPTYLVLMGLSLAGWRWQRRAAVVTAFGIGVATLLYSAWLAWQSAVVIGAWCILCIVLYTVNLGLTVTAGWALGKTAIGDTAGAGARVLGATAVGALVAFASSFGGYSQVKGEMAEAAASRAVAEMKGAEMKAPEAPAPAGGPPTKATAPATGGGGGEVKKVRLGEKRTTIAIPKTAPFLGPKDAKVTIVEFSDFQCPFCKRLAGTLEQLAEEYPRDVRVVFLQFPLNLDCNQAPLKKSMHPEACHAAAAGWCAAEQGKFWEMHDRLFEDQAGQKDKQYKAIAADLSLDTGRFASCLTAPATLAGIGKDTVLGGEADVSGTPAFFVNGRMMAGAQPIEVLRAVVEAELAGQQGPLALEVTVGTETLGTVDGAKPEVTVSVLPSPFEIYAFEASMEGKKAMSRAGVAPARSVSWFDARDACAASGKRLCTEAEWLSACTGTAAVDADKNGIASDDPVSGRKYGYGEGRKDGVCADSRNPAAVGELLTGNHPGCGTPDGIYDMIGGVKEWVGLSPQSAALKGGSYSSGESARCGYYRDDIAPDTRDEANGFRCCEGPAEIPAARPGRDVGEVLTPLEFPLVDANAGWKAGKKTVSTASLRGKPTVITFWASWCGPCKKELPALATLYEKYKAQGLQVLAVSVDSDPAKMSAYLSTNPFPFLIAADPDGAIMDTFSGRGVPTTLWVRKDGTIRLRTTGIPPGGEKRLEELVVELIGG